MLGRGVVALVGMAAWLTACTSYRQIDDLSLAGPDDVIRVSTVDGRTRDFHDPRIEADSLKGRLGSQGTVTYSIPLDQVDRVEVRETDVGATVALTLLIVAIPVTIALISAASGLSEPGY